MGNRPNWPPTRSGYNFYEAMSCMQKAIRRKDELLAYTMAWEMESAGGFAVMLNRLRITAMEDIGVADQVAGGYALLCCTQAADFYKIKNVGWRFCVVNAIVALCRAKNSRIANTLDAVVEKRWREGNSPTIPDWAFDMHTRKGKAMGRDHDHWIEHGAYIEGGVSIEDPYQQEAEEFWRRCDSKHPDTYKWNTYMDREGSPRGNPQQNAVDTELEKLGDQPSMFE